MPKNENFGIASSFGITTNRGYHTNLGHGQGVGPLVSRGVRSRPAGYPLFVVIPKDDVIPEFSFLGTLTGNFSDLELSDSLEMSRRIPRNFEIRKLPRKNAEKGKLWDNVVFWNYDK